MSRRRPRFALPLRELERAAERPLGDEVLSRPTQSDGDDPSAPRTPTLEKLLRLEQVIEFLGVSERTVRRAVADGRLKAIKLGGALRFRPSDVSGFIQQSILKI